MDINSIIMQMLARGGAPGGAMGGAGGPPGLTPPMPMQGMPMQPPGGVPGGVPGGLPYPRPGAMLGPVGGAGGDLGAMMAQLGGGGGAPQGMGAMGGMHRFMPPQAPRMSEVGSVVRDHFSNSSQAPLARRAERIGASSPMMNRFRDRFVNR